MREAEVHLYIYDLASEAVRGMSRSLLGIELEGIWHTSIVVHGKEYYFRGGIEESAPKSTVFGVPISEMSYGSTLVTQEELQNFFSEVGSRFTEETYNILTNNCNNFSNELLFFLVQKELPKYILDLPKLIASSPMGGLITSLFNAPT
jgi:desumoylating isopeptidase 1